MMNQKRQEEFEFLSTPSARRATYMIVWMILENTSFLSTPSARRATIKFDIYSMECPISIHALREEGDPKSDILLICLNIFLSTPSARRATRSSSVRVSISIHFYPRPPRGGRPMLSHRNMDKFWISIHALREEGDEKQ